MAGRTLTAVCLKRPTSRISPWLSFLSPQPMPASVINGRRLSSLNAGQQSSPAAQSLLPFSLPLRLSSSRLGLNRSVPLRYISLGQGHVRLRPDCEDFRPDIVHWGYMEQYVGYWEMKWDRKKKEFEDVLFESESLKGLPTHSGIYDEEIPDRMSVGPSTRHEDFKDPMVYIKFSHDDENRWTYRRGMLGDPILLCYQTFLPNYTFFDIGANGALWKCMFLTKEPWMFHIIMNLYAMPHEFFYTKTRISGEEMMWTVHYKNVSYVELFTRAEEPIDLHPVTYRSMSMGDIDVADRRKKMEDKKKIKTP